MKLSTIKKSLALLTAAALTFTMAGCNKKNDIPIAAKDNIFTAEQVNLSEKYDYITSMNIVNDNMYFIGNVSSTTGEGEDAVYSSTTKLDVFKADGTLISSVDIVGSDGATSDSGFNIINMCVMSDGTISVLKNESKWDEESFTSSDKYFILVYDINGKEIKNIDITDSIVGKENSDDYGYRGVSSMLIGNDGNYYICGNNAVYVLDADGKLVFEIEEEQSASDSNGTYITGINKTGDGRVVVIENSYEMSDDTYKSTNKAKVVDAATKSFGAEYPILSSSTTFFDGSKDHDLFIAKENTMCGYDLETGETTDVIDWLKSGFDTTTMNNFAMLSDGRIMCITYNYDDDGNGVSWSGNNYVVNILSKVDPSTIPDKQVITLYAWYLDYNVSQQVATFNKTNDKYMIEVTSYGDYADGSGDYMAGLTKLNNDLIAGNIPDILVLNYIMPVSSFIGKNMFLDLNTFIEKDEEINKEDLLPNVLEACTANGQLYEIFPSFTISTFVGKTENVGESMGWTIDEYKALAEANPDKSMLGSDYTKDMFLQSALVFSINQYVDKDTGVCSFNSDSFKKLLEIANTYPDKNNSEDNEYTYDYDAIQAEYREDKTLLSNAYLSSFNNIRELEQGQFGSPITFKGFPCDSKNGSIMYPSNEFSIMKGGKNPDGAWEFVKKFLTDDYQSKNDGYYPIKLSACTALMEAAKQKPFYVDENGNNVEYEHTYWISGQSIDIGVNTDEDNQKVMDFIKSVNQLGRVEQSLSNIITEESAAYFAGQKSVDEVADIIQNRANIYVNENR